MMFQKTILVCLLSAVAMITSPVFGVSNQDSKAVKKADNKGDAQRKKLEAMMSKKDYTVIYNSIRTSGNKAPDETLVKYLLEEDGYKDWDKLSSGNKKWLVTKIANKS